MMNFLDRVPQPYATWMAPVGLLQMTEEEYAALLREHGYGERYIAKELAQLREARTRHDLPGPPAEKDMAQSQGPIDRLAERRRGRKEGTT